MAKDNRKRSADDGFDDFKDDAKQPEVKASDAKAFDPTKPNESLAHLLPDAAEAIALKAEVERLKAEAAAARKDAEHAQKDAAYAYRQADKMAGELAALKVAAPVSVGGKFTVSIKDGPTATVDVPAGGRPEDVFNSIIGIHSTPHRHSVLAAAADAPCGIHYPDGSVRPFGTPA